MNAVAMWGVHRLGTKPRGQETVVPVIGTLALATAATITFLVAGGVWMFYRRWHSSSMSDKELSIFPEGTQYAADFEVASIWFSLAVVASAFVIPIIWSLCTQSVVLGAMSRQRRLAIMRLLGLSASDITKIALFESGVQASIAVLLGGGVSYLTLPVFTQLQFQGRNVEIIELILPWWSYVGIAFSIVLLALWSTYSSLRRVRIHPLGVSRREPEKSSSWVEIVIVVALFVAAKLAPEPDANIMFLALVGLIVVVNAGIFWAFGPMLLRVVASVAVKLPGNANVVGWNRVFANPRQAWKSSAPAAFFGLLIGYLLLVPQPGTDFGDKNLDALSRLGLWVDVATGVKLTVIFGLVLTGVSIFLQQANSIVESAGSERELQHLGVKTNFHLQVAIVSVLGPMMIFSVMGALISGGMGLVTAFDSYDWRQASDNWGLFGWLIAMWGVSFAAVLLAEPFRRMEMSQDVRRKD